VCCGSFVNANWLPPRGGKSDGAASLPESRIAGRAGPNVPPIFPKLR
jgi:hypothetical protein